MSYASPRRLSVAIAILALAIGACSGDSGPSSPTGPSPTAPPAPQTMTINGYVGDQSNGAPIGNAAVRASSGHTTTTGGNGYYELTGLAAGTVTITASADRYNSRSQSVTANGTRRVDLELVPFFRRTGSGAQVFDMPTSVSRVRIAGSYPGFCENFVVRIGGRLVVNEILGTCSVGIGQRIDGTYAATGGVVEVTRSSGVSWEIEQIQ